ncbi:MAG: nreB 4 [Mycobacterium sp.]|nr:nreB 4 [Mycobacterium sp.]
MTFQPAPTAPIALGAPERRASWVLRALLRAVMPIADLVVSTVWFVVSVTAFSLSVGLLPVFLLGLVFFDGFGRVTRWIAIVERHRMRLFLGIEIGEAPVSPRGFRQSLTHAPTWRAIGYSLLHFPLAVVTFSVTVSAWAVSGALVTMPWWLHRTPSRRADAWFFTVTDQSTAWWLVGAGVLVGVLAVVLTFALTSLEGELARALLGPTQRELERRVDELETSRSRVVDSVDAERRRIERDLHDGAQQRLVSLAMNLGRARSSYDKDPDGARLLLDEAHLDAKRALTELRDLARGIHPAVLTDRGLDAALSGLAGSSPVPVTVAVRVEPRCSPTIEAIAYFVVSEALANVAKHAQAHAVHIEVERAHDRLRVSVSDDGVGGADPARGTGLSGLRDRIAGVDGSLSVDSPVGGPTVLVAELPCAPPRS